MYAVYAVCAVVALGKGLLQDLDIAFFGALAVAFLNNMLHYWRHVLAPEMRYDPEKQEAT